MRAACIRTLARLCGKGLVTEWTAICAAKRVDKGGSSCCRTPPTRPATATVIRFVADQTQMAPNRVKVTATGPKYAVNNSQLGATFEFRTRTGARARNAAALDGGNVCLVYSAVHKFAIARIRHRQRHRHRHRIQIQVQWCVPFRRGAPAKGASQIRSTPGQKSDSKFS